MYVQHTKIIEIDSHYSHLANVGQPLMRGTNLLEGTSTNTTSCGIIGLVPKAQNVIGLSLAQRPSTNSCDGDMLISVDN